uniref:Conserved protein n=1 Tax=Haptophyceae sp. NIES-3900 TaxID=2748608 RepID=A0A7R7AKA6_9EUKA|nr:conserved protein [Haptophyceae sp. NIES-3900]
MYAFRDFSNVFVWLLTVRITIFWFPNLYWWEMPWYVVVVITDPYLRMWRGLFPGVFGLDLSTILAFMFVQYLQGVIERGIISTLDVLAGMMSLSL